MSKIIGVIRNNPVRCYTVVIAAMTVVQHYVDIPTEVWLPLVAALFGIGGEVTRAKVTPNSKI